VAMCPKRGYGERTRADEEGDAPDIQFQMLALLIRHRRPAAGRHGQPGVGATGTATADSRCCDRVERPSFSYLSEKFCAPGRTRTCATGSGGQSGPSTASFWCVPVPLSWPFGPGSASWSAQTTRIDRQL